jgi:hypothetical protein
MFNPNEHVYEFMNESDTKMFEYALKEKVIPTPTITLFSPEKYISTITVLLSYA